MANLVNEVPSIMLMGPGPSCVAPETYKAMSMPTIGHMDPYFIKIMDSIKSGLRQLMETDNNVTVPISGTGSAGMETAFVNSIVKGDKVLVLVNGVFGKRMVDVAQRLGADVTEIEFPWGTPVDVDNVKLEIEKQDFKIVAMVHAETSTGVRNPAAEIGELIKGDTLYILDCVTSLGGIPVKADEWGVDILYSGSQKCLSCPPGVAPVTLSEKAMAKVSTRQAKVPNWYLDINLLTSYWGGNSRVYHHTAPINMMYALYQAITLVLEEEVENVFARHQAMHEKLVAGLEELGLEMHVAKPFRLPMLNNVKIPDGLDEAALRSRLLNEFKIEIGAGLGPLAGKVLRFGLMGHTARPENVDRLLSALKVCLA